MIGGGGFGEFGKVARTGGVDVVGDVVKRRGGGGVISGCISGFVGGLYCFSFEGV